MQTVTIRHKKLMRSKARQKRGRFSAPRCFRVILLLHWEHCKSSIHHSHSYIFDLFS